MLNRTQHRFWFSLVALMVVLSIALSACGPRTELPDAAPAAEEAAAEAEAAPAESVAAASGERNTQTEFNGEYNQAQMLKERVAAGEIPALADRLPAEPLMVEPYESIGLYGGTWRRAFTGVKDFHAWERNPYYWQTDTAGNQLPYIDRVHMALVENGEAVAVKAAAGELDMQSRHLGLGSLPVLKDNEEAGNFTVSLWSSDGASSIGLQPNQSYDDPQYRELMQNRDFRCALSLSIDRNLFNDIVFLGQATVTNQCVGPATSWYVEDMAMFQADYDPAAAQALLDGIGLLKGDDGIYTFADGSELNLVIESSSTDGEGLDALELITEQINEVGLKTTLKTMSRDLYWPRACCSTNMPPDWDCTRHQGCPDSPLSRMVMAMPMGTPSSMAAALRTAKL